MRIMDQQQLTPRAFVAAGDGNEEAAAAARLG
jgi:hypothetical protein